MKYVKTRQIRQFIDVSWNNNSSPSNCAARPAGTCPAAVLMHAQAVFVLLYLPAVKLMCQCRSAFTAEISS